LRYIHYLIINKFKQNKYLLINFVELQDRILSNFMVTVLLKNLSSSNDELRDLIKLCLETEDINKRIGLVYAINNLIPLGLQIKIPALVTNYYIDQKLYSLEENYL
jgi:hypothetical protein